MIFANREIISAKYVGRVKRMAVDHWRAHSTYKMINKGIAVLLCER